MCTTNVFCPTGPDNGSAGKSGVTERAAVAILASLCSCSRLVLVHIGMRASGNLVAPPVLEEIEDGVQGRARARIHAGESGNLQDEMSQGVQGRVGGLA